MKTLAITPAAILMSAASSFAQCKAKVGTTVSIVSARNRTQRASL